MTENELDEIAQRLGFALPGAYRATLLAYPFPPDSFGDDCMLPNRPADVIDLNAAALPVPSNVHQAFFVGSDGGEETYFLDTARFDSPVYVFELETGQSRVLAPSWEAYLQHIRETHAEIAVDEEAARLRELTKRWWEFWK
ncbi:MAG: SMI1/KNR4 family protein [bacterium]